jgi:hypothetical protein
MGEEYNEKIVFCSHIIRLHGVLGEEPSIGSPLQLTCV